ncbi:carboxypeptidase regulatory-like domain-containing protein [Nocardioides sp. AX2bis]|uniref:carboxypeptidase regulatory-like domain-containing protein n=1 Tax=Nocardioides sp. AX2bis TaxID=2653157 RepID=UPI0012F2E0A7|nr:carboxypeptidase-like regulatory domain-containing protein [Nocardioides sp. AX2bis]VXC00931.1 Carboxypeptidase regulatory-like domain-containing protein [Nocardioides sp. AX2bis]
MRRSLPATTAATTAAATMALLALTLVPAAAETDAWASWEPLTGSPNDYATTMRQAAPGFPAAALTTDSRAGVQLAGGTSTFLAASTPPGAAYGASRGNPYLVLRPRADTATAPSTSTYAFADPTPATGWAFVLGDVDADQVRVDATDASGDRVPDAAVDRWFQGTFNYAGGDDEPTWDAGSATLVGNDQAADSDGAAGWFEPDRRLTSLTFTFTRRAGFPVFQTWFVSRARSVTGEVSDVSPAGSSCTVEGTRLVLLSPYGDRVAATTAEADGSYDLGDVATQGGYVVRATAPDDCAVVGVAERTVATSGPEGSPASQADFEVREVVPQPISGAVRDDDGRPVAGVDVTVTSPVGDEVTTTTGPDGTYLVDANEEGTGYTISIEVPEGYRAGPGGATIEDVEVGDEDVVGQDFEVVELATVGGRVTGGGGGLGGVPVTLAPVGGGAALVAVTDGRGRWDLTGVPAGAYRLSVDAPRGYTGGDGRRVTVGDDDLRGLDVALARPGALGGRVTDDDGAVEDVALVVTGPGGATRRLATDADGRYFLDGLRRGTWTVRVVAPAGQEVVGRSTATARITRAGEVRGGRDFVLDAVPLTATGTTVPYGASPSATPSAAGTVTTTPTPTSSATATPLTTATTSPGTSSTGVLPDTGGPALALVLLAGGLIAGGGALLVVGRRGRSSAG